MRAPRMTSSAATSGPPMAARKIPSRAPSMRRLRLTGRAGWARTVWSATRSEEHTSELQSQSNLVCRLLLEKKKKTKRPERMRENLALLDVELSNERLHDMSAL